MKRFILFLVTILIGYIIYFDLTTGTLPSVTEQKTIAKERVEDKNTQNYFTYTVKAGETVLSIVEEQLDASIPVPINQVIIDFKKLNNIEPEEIHIGKSYKFPNYKEKGKRVN